MDSGLSFGVLAVSSLSTLNLTIVRVIPHVSNFSPVISAVNFGFFSIKNSVWATVSVLCMIFISDMLLHFLNNPNIYPIIGAWMLYVYPIHILNGFLSKYIIKTPDQLVNIGVTCTLTSFNFFWMSNLGYYLIGQSKQQFLTLKEVYYNAIPFFPLEILSNFVYSIIFFSLHYFFVHRNQNQPGIDQIKKQNLLPEEINQVV